MMRWKLAGGMALVLALALHLAVQIGCMAGEPGRIGNYSPTARRTFLRLALAAQDAYEEDVTGLESTPSGCVALIREDAGGGLIIAFRGSMLGDRNPKHRFSTFGGATMRRNYRDWAATNLKQITGFLPRQYTEAAALVVRHIQSHPEDKPVYITGHSKGGGAATYAYAAAAISPAVTDRQWRRVRCATFNAAVIKEQNWRRMQRLQERERGGASDRRPEDGAVVALCMRDDVVSKLAAAEERPLVRRVIIDPTGGQTAGEQHGIEVIVEELEKLVPVSPPARPTWDRWDDTPGHVGEDGRRGPDANGRDSVDGNSYRH